MSSTAASALATGTVAAVRDLAQAELMAILADVEALVVSESSSADRAALDATLDLLLRLTMRRLGEPTTLVRHPGGHHGDIAVVTYVGDAPGSVAVVGHYDTVWPTGTLADWPVRRWVGDDGRERLTGPGVLDMKFGLVQGVWALSLARAAGLPVPTVTFCFTGDEEVGSIASRPVIEALAADVDATLVLEASANGAVKTGRKGTGQFEITATGIEAHAGLEPENGASAVHALLAVLAELVAAADPAAGTTINVGTISGGSATNVVARTATASVDVRVSTPAEQARITAVLDGLAPADSRVSLQISDGWTRPPMTLTDTSRPLLDTALAAAAELGHELAHMSVGGASDANFVAALGRPVLCGLGGVGAGPHARHESILVDTVATQVALVAGILAGV